MEVHRSTDKGIEGVCGGDGDWLHLKINPTLGSCALGLQITIGKYGTFIALLKAQIKSDKLARDLEMTNVNKAPRPVAYKPESTELGFRGKWG